MNKLGSKWIVLCTAAIGLTYAAGYLVTEPDAAAKIGSDQKIHRHVPISSPKSAANAGRQTQSKYKDGRYSGYGENRIGAVTVQVTIRNGKITGVQITDCTTSYPQSKIDQLPQQVIGRQSAQVENVTGATESATDFMAAVTDALRQAKN